MANQRAYVVSTDTSSIVNDRAATETATQILSCVRRLSILFVALKDQVLDGIARDQFLHQFGRLVALLLGNCDRAFVPWNAVVGLFPVCTSRAAESGLDGAKVPVALGDALASDVGGLRSGRAMAGCEADVNQAEQGEKWEETLQEHLKILLDLVVTEGGYSCAMSLSPLLG